MCAILFGCDGKQDGVSDAVNKVSFLSEIVVAKNRLGTAFNSSSVTGASVIIAS